MPLRGVRSWAVELKPWLDRSMNWVGFVSSGVGSGPEVWLERGRESQREGAGGREREGEGGRGREREGEGGMKRGREREREREPDQRKGTMLPASPVGTKAKAKARADADCPVSFMLLLTLLLNFGVS